MAERPRPQWASCHSPSTNNCQDLGNSILLLLGLIICTIRFQQTVEGRPLRSEMQSELGLEAYVYPVNPPPHSPQALSHRNSRVAYNARDVRRRLRELTRELEALSHCYPPVSGSSTAEGTGKAWVYRSLRER
ncbi:hypothetical protein E2I00_008719 [Balaenoptera physalus]|uniref:Uncharacterized protein n=1 Tax=Balaenoptera physalus TaxID=9770 RepID=A0A6A1QI40_BALPH|nr:hypothetical protein E2I00_008719 [Balaenoptera physalus]